MTKTKQTRKSVILRRIWKWWTIQNWKDALDIATKLAAIFGALAITSLFLLKPNIIWDVTYIYSIDREGLIKTYEENGKPIPTPVDNISGSVEISGSWGVSEADLTRRLLENLGLYKSLTGDQVNINAAEISEERLTDACRDALETSKQFFSSKTPVTPEMEKIVRDYFGIEEVEWDEYWRVVIPPFASTLLDEGENLDPTEMRFHLEALDKSQKLVAQISIRNLGQALATDVRVYHPYYWEAATGFENAEMPPQTLLKYEYKLTKEAFQRIGQYGYCDFPIVTTVLVDRNLSIAPGEDFYVSWKDGDVLNTNAILYAGVGLLAFWILTVVKEIFVNNAAPDAEE